MAYFKWDLSVIVIRNQRNESKKKKVKNALVLIQKIKQCNSFGPHCGPVELVLFLSRFADQSQRSWLARPQSFRWCVAEPHSGSRVPVLLLPEL